jgi:hypothetical protein
MGAAGSALPESQDAECKAALTNKGEASHALARAGFQNGPKDTGSFNVSAGVYPFVDTFHPQLDCAKAACRDN